MNLKMTNFEKTHKVVDSLARFLSTAAVFLSSISQLPFLYARVRVEEDNSSMVTKESYCKASLQGQANKHRRFIRSVKWRFL